MKFAQYLQETQTPEWKKAYIDYRGLKKRIAAIRKSQQGLVVHVTDSDSPGEETLYRAETPRPSSADIVDNESIGPQQSIAASAKQRSVKDDDILKESRPVSRVLTGIQDGGDQQSSSRPSLALKDKKASSTGKFLSSLRIPRGKSFSSRMNGSGGNSRRVDPMTALPLHQLRTQLSPVETAFFTMLDAQLDKVESFYLAREKEMLARGRMLQMQLNELNDHRKLFHKAHPNTPWATALKTAIKIKLRINPPDRLDTGSVRTDNPGVKAESAPHSPVKDDTLAASSAVEASLSSVAWGKQRDLEEDKIADASDDNSLAAKDRQRHQPLSSDPDSYLFAKRKLKKAVLEHYRGLEVLHNYRVLNITGFRKALKKFEKVTRITVQNQYMSEKVDKSAFSSDKALQEMMTQMEEMYAAAFSRGDRKKATRRLRAGAAAKSHHFSAFRSGLYLGLAVPAVVDGLVKVNQSSTREAIPSWSTLLFLYGVLLVPVLFSVLVGLNLLVWARARINYVFIFELDVMTRLDYREYFEIPVILLSALCYAFWLSFAHIGAPMIAPTLWPLVWLGFTAIVVVDPFPLMYRSSRFWLLRNVGKQFISGTRKVEFTDFWMGDQFCSLVFTLTNLYTFACVYAKNFPTDLRSCGSGSWGWGISFALAILPLLVRLVQSVKRYVDSGLITHLINGGKYGTGIVTYFLYFYWRHKGGHGTIFALWCLWSVIYSIYACSWDLLMDWSLIRIHDTKYPLLRRNLVYTNYIYTYYIAIVSNIILRFLWVIYLPHRGPSLNVRSFIAGMLEMLRRWQWNFFRLENEHLGNMDQYRITREVPLPYNVDEMRGREDDGDEDHEQLKSSKRKRVV